MAERENIRSRLKKHQLTQVWLINQLGLTFSLGYSILGTSKEECMFILHGKTTRNGKSTMLDAIQHLLGDYSTVTPVEGHNIIGISLLNTRRAVALLTLSKVKPSFLKLYSLIIQDLLYSIVFCFQTPGRAGTLAA